MNYFVVELRDKVGTTWQVHLQAECRAEARRKAKENTKKGINITKITKEKTGAKPQLLHY